MKPVGARKKPSRELSSNRLRHVCWNRARKPGLPKSTKKWTQDEDKYSGFEFKIFAKSPND
jgi:hypothetical protein